MPEPQDADDDDDTEIEDEQQPVKRDGKKKSATPAKSRARSYSSSASASSEAQAADVSQAPAQDSFDAGGLYTPADASFPVDEPPGTPPPRPHSLTDALGEMALASPPSPDKRPPPSPSIMSLPDSAESSPGKRRKQQPAPKKKPVYIELSD